MAQILVVDDEPDVRELFNITLKMAGHQTETARDGQEAVDKLAAHSPDLILLDLMMPRMDGFAFLSHVRSDQGGKPMRVLIATAKTLEDADQRKLASWPVVGVLNKGNMDIAQMVSEVSSALAHNPVRPNGGSKPAGAEKTNGEATGKSTAEPSAAKPAAAAPTARSNKGEKPEVSAKPSAPPAQTSSEQEKPGNGDARSKRQGGWLSGLKLR